VNPVPIELPLRPSEAAQLAELIHDLVAGRPLSDDLRNRLTGRAAAAELQTVRPYFGSLEADPVHAGAYFLAVDGLSSGVAEPLLLHMAPAAAPASSLFPKPLLIGRMRPGGGREMVINAIPFGPGEAGSVEVFAREMGGVFLPRPHGLLPSVRVWMERPALTAPAVFKAFRTIYKTTGRNLASFRVAPSAALFWETVWTAIRAGYRDGYTMGGERSEESARLFSFFSLAPGEMAEAVKELRALRPGEAFDVEADLTSCQEDEVAAAVEAVRAGEMSVQSVLLPEGLRDLDGACAAVNATGALPALAADPYAAGEMALIRAATNARLTLVIRVEGADAEPLLEAVEALR
jgi:hypothetical protein